MCYLFGSSNRAADISPRGFKNTGNKLGEDMKAIKYTAGLTLEILQLGVMLVLDFIPAKRQTHK